MAAQSIEPFKINLTTIKVGVIKVKSGVQIPLEFDQLSRQSRGFPVLTDRLHLFAFETRQRFVQPLQIAVLDDELGRGFGPNPRHTGNVVGGVAHQRQDVPHHVRLHALGLEHIRRGHQGIFHRIKHVHPRRTQLGEVLVAAGNSYRQIGMFCGAPGDDRSNGVIGLHPLKTEHRNMHQAQELQTSFHLGAKVFRGFVSVGFVIGIQLGAERFGIPRRVNHHHQLGGLVRANHVEQSPRKAVHQMGWLPRHRTGHATTDRVVRPKEGRVAVNNPKSVHGLMLFGARQPRSAKQNQSGLFKPNRIHHHRSVVFQGDCLGKSDLAWNIAQRRRGNRQESSYPRLCQFKFRAGSTVLISLKLQFQPAPTTTPQHNCRRRINISGPNPYLWRSQRIQHAQGAFGLPLQPGAEPLGQKSIA